MGKSRTHSGRFKKGHDPYLVNHWTLGDSNPVPFVRLPQDMYEEVTNAPCNSPLNVETAYRLLRPIPKPVETGQSTRYVRHFYFYCYAVFKLKL